MLDQIELGRRLGRFDVDFSGGLAARRRALSESLRWSEIQRGFNRETCEKHADVNGYDG